ncbi:hypothetical protein [Rhabdaerophilum sp. SD176]|uniref:hypothetical protein n=1 Tax=Rhabdaerophilum sp. SD176 TaxID=2983548 RepID=UPI0024DFE252|nr:hypothetical protein [Rhabdaerophilum sp. SD176]
MNRIAAEEGDVVEDPAAAIRKLDRPKLTEFETAKVLHRLKHGYAREAYRPGSGVANVPDLALLDRACMEEGSFGDEAVRSICAGLAKRRAEIECEADNLYTKALNAPEEPVTKGEPKVCFDGCEHAWTRPAHQMGDLIASDNILIDLTEEGAAVSPMTLSPPLTAPPIATVTELPRNVVIPVPADTVTTDPDFSDETGISIDQLVEDLIGTGTWGAKTAAQVRGVAHLFQRMAGSQHTSALNEHNFVRYRQLLTRISCNYGKSPRISSFLLIGPHQVVQFQRQCIDGLDASAGGEAGRGCAAVCAAMAAHCQRGQMQGKTNV